MRVIAGIFGLALLLVAVVDAFRAVVVARHAHSLPTITRMFYRVTWAPFAMGARLIGSEQRRESYLGIYGPLSLASTGPDGPRSVIAAFAMLQWCVGFPADGGPSRIAQEIYFSAATFFTLGASVAPNMVSKFLIVIEAGFGFTFLGLVIGYLPVLYQSFQPGTSNPTPGRARRLAPIRNPVLPSAGKRFHGVARTVSGLGRMGAGSPSEPPFVSDARLLSLSAREPILARGPYHCHRCQRAHHAEHR